MMHKIYVIFSYLLLFQSKNLRKVGSTIKSAQQKDSEKSEGMLEVMGARTTGTVVEI